MSIVVPIVASNSYLVDPASSHMLVSKIKPCMSKYGESGFDSGEGALKTATTSKEGSRHANYPMTEGRGSDEK